MTFTIPPFVALLLISLGTIIGTKVIAGLLIAFTSGEGLIFIWLMFKAWKRLLMSTAAALILAALGAFAGFPVIAVLGGSFVAAVASTVDALRRKT